MIMLVRLACWLPLLSLTLGNDKLASYSLQLLHKTII